MTRARRLVVVDSACATVNGGRFERAARMLDAAAGAGLEPVLFAARPLASEHGLPWLVLPIFDENECASSARRDHASTSRAVREDLEAALTRLNAGAEDHFLVVDPGAAEVEGVAALLATRRVEQGSRWHLLLRRPPAEGETRSPGPGGVDAVRLSDALEAAMGGARGQLQLHVDSTVLCAEWGALGFANVEELPIPAIPAARRSRRATGLTIACLGAARPEKAFQYLPRVVEALLAQPEGPPVRFRIHAHADGPANLDVERARGALQLLGDAGRLELSTDGLTRAGYRADLLEADIAVAPYLQGSYWARSSGVVADAVSAGIPVVVTAGTSMSRIVDQAAHAHHVRRLAASSTAENVNGSELKWRSYGGPGDDRGADDRATLDGIRVGGSDSTYARIPLSAPATHGWLTFELAASDRDSFVEVTVAQLDAAGRELGLARRVVGGVSGTPLSTVFQVLRNTRTLWLAFRNALGPTPVTLGDLRLAFVRSRRDVAASPAGVTFAEGFDDEQSVGRLIVALVDMVRRYSLYADAAAEHATDFADRHSSARFVERLLVRP